ncbi:SCO4225 family membrane protein [Streptomyces sp. NPDC050548]|uniref:SCO4225 family membrane protein n=1 Tax=Streptomyces sp. NPDC050548 TaxID=3365629 RepID=UPI00378850B8
MTGTDAHAARSPLHRLGRNLRNPFALSYLALCAVLLLWAIAVNIPDDSDGAMAVVVPLMATAPASLVLLALPGGAAVLIVAVVLGALVNASIIGWCARALTRGNRPDATR